MEVNELVGRQGYSNSGQSTNLYMYTFSEDFGMYCESPVSWIKVGSISWRRDGYWPDGSQRYRWTFPLTLEANTSGEVREASLVITMEDTPQTFNIWQAASTENKYANLGDDAEIEIKNCNRPIQFEVWRNGYPMEPLFIGTTVPQPNTTTAKIKLNHLVAEYMNSELKMQDSIVDNFGYTMDNVQCNDSYQRFFITASNGYFGNWNVMNSWYPTGKYMESYPITKTVGYTTPLLVTGQQCEFELELEDGTLYNIDNGNADVACFRLAHIVSGKELKPQKFTVYDDRARVLTEYTYDGCDGDWLAYVNQSGGWDTLYFNSCQKIEANDFSSYTSMRGGKTPFRNDITERYSGYIRIDEEGQNNLHHLLNSPVVYFNTFKEEGRVVITNTEAESAKNGRSKTVNITFEKSLKERR